MWQKMAACVLACISFTATNAASGSSHIDSSVEHAIGCVVTDPIMADQLATLGLHKNKIAFVNFHKGAIDKSDHQKNLISIVVWATNRKNGLLFFVIPGDAAGQQYQVAHNVYSLKKLGGHWQASEGNGGYETYREIGNFVTKISKQRRLQLKLTPRTDGCSSF